MLLVLDLFKLYFVTHIFNVNGVKTFVVLLPAGVASVHLSLTKRTLPFGIVVYGMHSSWHNGSFGDDPCIYTDTIWAELKAIDDRGF
jgi:hypothetical protein